MVWFDFSVRAPGKYHTTIYPYIHQTCNNRSSADQVRPVVVPDVDPTDVPPDLNFSMAAGDFLEVYTEQGTCKVLIDTLMDKCGFDRNNVGGTLANNSFLTAYRRNFAFLGQTSCL